MQFFDVTPASPISGITLHDGDIAVVLSGGTAMDVVVQNGAEITLSSGGTASFTTLSGGFEFVSSGGAVTGTVLKGGTEAVSSGGVARFSVVSGDGGQAVYSGGSALGAVLSGGLQAVYAGGSVSGTTVSNGGGEFVYSGGAATGTVLSGGGSLTVNSGGSAVFAAVSNGGTETVFAGGLASFTMVSGGGFELVSGGVARGTVISGGGGETVVAGGVASGTVVSGLLAAQTVSSGGEVSGTVVDGTFATETVSSGGVAMNTTVRDGFVSVSSGGTASFTVVSNGFLVVSRGGSVLSDTVAGGFEQVSFSGVANFTTVLSGFQQVLSGGTASGTTVSGGIQQVGSGGTADATVVSGGGSQQVRGGTAFSAVLSGGFQTVTAGGIASGTVVRNGSHELVASGGTAGGTVVDSGGMLIVSGGGAARFIAVSSGGSIDFPGLVYSGGGLAVITGTDMLTVTEGGGSATLQLEGTFMGKTFQTARDSSGGTVVTLLDSPRTLVWTGAQDRNFANAADWNDVTNGLNPAGSPPGATDTAEFLTGGGTITGTGTAAALEFGGLAAWEVNSSASLSAEAGVTVGQNGSGTLLVSGGASVNGLGTFDDISGSSGGVASVTVTGAGSTWQSSGELIVGDAGAGELTVTNAANVSAAAAGSLPAMALGAGGGGTGSLLVTGAGSRAMFTGELDVGQAGGGTLTVSNQGTVQIGARAASPSGLDIAELPGGSGEATVTGVNSLLSNAGRFIVGDAGLGGLSVDAGASVTTTADAIIANTSDASGSSVNVTGAGSNLTVAGTLIVGDAGSGSLSLSQGASVTASSLDVAAGATGDGSVSLVGAGTTLTVTGALTLGDQAAGELSILGGARMTIAGGLVGGLSGAGGNLDIEGTGSQLTINGGTLVVGENGPAEFTLGIGATLKGEVATDLFGITNEFGDVDPATDPNDGTLNVGNSQGGSSQEYDFFVANSGTINIKGTATFYTPLVTFETGAQDLSINGLWVIGAKDTLVMNATSVDASQAFDFASAAGAALVIGRVPGADVTNLDTLDGQTMPTLTGSVAPGAANVLAGWAAPIENYASGDAITLAGLAYGSATASGDVVTMWPGAAGQGTPRGSLTFLDKNGNPSNAQAALAATQINALACFVAGTRIGTDSGLVAVEDLAVGDRVRTHDGGCEPVVWVGSRAVDCARHPRPETVWPVCVTAGAFGENVPGRDLYLSPEHAVFVNDVLVPVKLLVNGTSIVQVERKHVVYYHVELPEHAVILAEGLAVESYLDTGDRGEFGEGGTIRLYPDFAVRAWEMASAAPLIITGPKLIAVRQRVNAHAMNAIEDEAVA